MVKVFLIFSCTSILHTCLSSGYRDQIVCNKGYYSKSNNVRLKQHLNTHTSTANAISERFRVIKLSTDNVAQHFPL